MFYPLWFFVEKKSAVTLFKCKKSAHHTCNLIIKNQDERETPQNTLKILYSQKKAYKV